MMSLVQIKTSIYSKLVADTGLVALLGGVNIYDIAQEDAVLPYISYSKITSKTAHELSSDGVEHFIGFVIVAKADSSLTTHNIMARIEAIFDEQFNADDLGAEFKILSINLVQSQIEQVDFERVKASMQFRFLIEKVAT